MICSEGTEFNLDFRLVQIHHRDFHLAQGVAKAQLVPTGPFGGLAQGELADLEEADGELKRQLLFDFAARPAARYEQSSGYWTVISTMRILYGKGRGGRKRVESASSSSHFGTLRRSEFTL